MVTLQRVEGERRHVQILTIPGSEPEVHFPPTPREPSPWDTIPKMSGRRGLGMYLFQAHRFQISKTKGKGGFASPF